MIFQEGQQHSVKDIQIGAFKTPAASLYKHTQNEQLENQVLTAKVILPKISSGITSSNTLYTYL